MDQPNKKQVLLDTLKKLGIISNTDTGQIVIHLNQGGIAKVTKMVEVK